MSIWIASWNQLRINVQLVDARTGAHLWAERFELERQRLPAWQNDIVGRIATALNYRLTKIESERMFRAGRDSPDAYDLTTQGWAMIYTAKTSGNYEVARVLFTHWSVIPGRWPGSAGLRQSNCSPSTRITSSSIMCGVSDLLGQARKAGRPDRVTRPPARRPHSLCSEWSSAFRLSASFIRSLALSTASRSEVPLINLRYRSILSSSWTHLSHIVVPAFTIPQIACLIV
jgi:hypothetical protein